MGLIWYEIGQIKWLLLMIVVNDIASIINCDSLGVLFHIVRIQLLRLDLLRFFDNCSGSIFRKSWSAILISLYQLLLTEWA